jgi:dihydroorotase
VTPHHLFLTDEAVKGYDTDTKMMPPLRSEVDRQALQQGLADGTIDAIATDHAPHHVDDKCIEYDRAAFGIVGLETAVSLCLDRLVNREIITLSRFVELFSARPAQVLGLNKLSSFSKGSLAVGADADITILDTRRRVAVRPESFRSKSRNTPFKGWELQGGPVTTIVGGRIVWQAADETS